MTKEKEYFIYLLNCCLNHKIPSYLYDLDWQGVYNLSEIHNVCAFVTSTLKKLPAEHQPVGEVRSAFNQQLGYTVMSCDKKSALLSRLRAIFDKNHIDYMFVKGALLKELYPVPEFRTSGDFDVIVRPEMFDCAVRALLSENAEITDRLADTYSFRIDDMLIELHKHSDVGVAYFEDMFSLARQETAYEYRLDLYNHLLYVICHMLKHFAYQGAGIRMLMDVDVLIRSAQPFDEKRFYAMCETAGVLQSAKTLISLSNYFFDTPAKADIDFAEDRELLSLFEKVMLDGGSFGFEQGTLGAYYLTKGMKSNKPTLLNKIRGLSVFLFPERDYIINRYPYAAKNAFCLAFAYLQRMFVGLFRRKKHSKNTIHGILKDSNISSVQKELLNLLEIEKK